MADVKNVPVQNKTDVGLLALVLSGLVLVMSALVVVPALVLGYGSKVHDDRVHTLVLNSVDSQADWTLIEKAEPFEAAYRAGKKGVFFMHRPLGSQDLALALVLDGKNSWVMCLDVPGAADLHLLRPRLERYNVLLQTGVSQSVGHLDPAVEAEDQAFLGLVKSARNLLGKKGS